MANSLTTSFTHTYAGREFFQELFFKPQEGGDDIFGNYKVMQVVDKTNLYIPNNLSETLKKYSTCGFSQVGTTTISDRTIDVTKVKVNLEECEDAFDNTIFEEAIRQGVDIDDLRGTVVEDMLRQSMMQSLGVDISRIQWFGDDASSSTNYDHFDGWVQLAEDAGASLGQTLDMSADTSIETSGSDDTLVADGTQSAFKQLWEGQSKTLRAIDRSMKKLYVTSSIMDNYLSTLEDTQNETGQMNLEDGKTSVRYRGVEVVEVKGWDTHLADTNNPQKTAIGANMIVLTTPDNLIVGADIMNPNNQVKVWYSEDDEVIRMKIKFKLGAQILHPELMSLAT